MAFSFLLNFHLHAIPNSLYLLPPNIRASKVLELAKCTSSDNQIITRRAANYHPSIWEYEYIQSLTSSYQEDSYLTRADKLKEEIAMMLKDTSKQLELIDTLQRLGIYYHFEEQIMKIFESIYINYSTDRDQNEQDLYSTALKFRLFRQHGYNVPEGIFNKFKDEKGKFKTCLCENIKGILYLYEASYLWTSGENVLEEARDFARKNMMEFLDKKMYIDKNDVVATLVSHALELPLHWRLPRLEARWFIDVYENTKSRNNTLLEFAKLDFNMVQAIHQQDLKYMSRWWKNTGLGEKMKFARDRLEENFFWTVGFGFEPQFQYCRRMETKVLSFLTIIDDIYDVYATLDELQFFTDAIERWDINEIEQLPDYMKICFLALYNSTNEMAYDALKEQNLNIISVLKNSWKDICKCYMLEAKWYYTGYIPTLAEYMENAWISVTVPVILVHAYCFVTNPYSKDALECLGKYPSLIRLSAIIVRLADDLGTSHYEIKRGDNPKSIHCYMNETGATEDEAREYINHLISETWKEMNEELVVTDDSPFSKKFVEIAMNLIRTAQCVYGHGDGFGIADSETRDHVISLFIKPISL